MKPVVRKKLFISLGIFILLALIAALFIPKLLDPDLYHEQIVSELEKASGGKVRIGDISWGVLKGLWLEVDGFELSSAFAFPMEFRLSRIYANVSISSLLKRKILLSHLRLESPEVRLRLQPGPQKTAREQKPPAAEAKPTRIALPIEIEDLLVTKARVRIEDDLTRPGKPMTRDFGDVEIRASNLAPGRKMLFDISMKDGGSSGLGALTARGTFTGLTEFLTLQNPKLTVHATLSALSAEALKPYLGNAPFVQQLSGSLSMAVNYEGDLAGHHRAEGSMDLGQVTFSYPSLWEAALPGSETKITYRADLQADELTVESLEVKVGEFSFRARGGVTNLKERPMIKNASFSADVPLLDSVSLFPWKALGDSAPFVRSIFEGGGKVEIEQALIPAIDLAEPPATAVVLLNAIESTSRISGVSVQLAPGVPRIKNIDINVRLVQGTAHVQVLRAQFTTVDLPAISGKVAKLFEEPLIDVVVKGPLLVNKNPPDDLAAFFRRWGVEEVNGSANLDTAVVLDTSQPAKVQISGGVRLRDVQARTVFTPARIEGLHADLAVTPGAAKVTSLSTGVTVPAAEGGRFDLQLEAAVDDWSRRPAVTLQNLRTSPVALPVVASLIPWEKLGEFAEPLRQTFINGGTVTIEEVALPRVELFNLPKSPVQLLPQSKAAARFAGIAVRPYPSLPGFEDIRGRMTLEKGVLTAARVKGRMGPLSLPDLNIRISRLDGLPKVTVAAKGPVELAATSDERVEDLLKRYGLKSLVVSAEVDVHAEHDPAVRKGWVTDASLVLAKVRAESYPKGVVLDNLQGRVTVRHKKGTEITAENIKGQVNQAPVRLSGKVVGVGTRNLLIDVDANARHLELAHLRELFPALKNLNLAGTVEMDLDIYVPYAAAGNSRLHGMLSTRNLTFRTAHMAVEKGDVELKLSGNSAVIQRAQVQINDVLFAVAGQVADPVEPTIQVHVTSPSLNLDRLIPQPGAQTSEAKPSQKQGGRAPEKTMKLPPIALRTTARLQVDADKGRYRGMEFEKLTLDATYDRGVIKRGDLSFDMEGGRAAMTGSGDIRNPENVSFTVSPDIKSLSLERLAAIFGVHDVSVSGPISANGRLQGRAGRSRELLASLQGNVEGQIGPGKMARIGRGGELLARVLSLTSLRGILTGSVFDKFASEGLPFQSIRARTAFSNGNMDLAYFLFESNVMNLEAQGRVNLLEEEMEIRARLKPLGEVSTVVGAVPLVGKIAASLTEIHFNVSGSLEDPRVYVIPGQGVARAVENQAKGVGSTLKGATDFLGKEENKWIKK